MADNASADLNAAVTGGCLRHGRARPFAIHFQALPRDIQILGDAAALGRTGVLARRNQFVLSRAISMDISVKSDVDVMKRSDPSCNWVCDKGSADVQR